MSIRHAFGTRASCYPCDVRVQFLPPRRPWGNFANCRTGYVLAHVLTDMQPHSVALTGLSSDLSAALSGLILSVRDSPCWLTRIFSGLPFSFCRCPFSHLDLWHLGCFLRTGGTHARLEIPRRS